MWPGAPREGSSRRTAFGADRQDDTWGPLPPRSRKPALVLLAVLLVSGVGGFGTFLFLTGDVGQVTSAETSATTTAPYETTTTMTTTTTEPEPEEEAPPAEEEDADQAPTTEEPEAPPEEAQEPDDAGGVSGPGPEETVRTFWSSMKSGDCETVVDLMTEESWSMGGSVSREQAVASCKESPGSALDMEVQDVKLVAEEQNEAAVEVTLSYSGEAMNQVMGLQVEDGRWKVAGY